MRYTAIIQLELDFKLEKDFDKIEFMHHLLDDVDFNQFTGKPKLISIRPTISDEEDL